MSATSEETGTPQLGGWTDGENNMRRSVELADTELRRCVNYDVTDTGRLVRRAGYEKIVSGISVVPGSLFCHEDIILFVADGNLYQLEPDTWARRIIRAGIGNSRVSYLALNGTVYWTNGITTGTTDGYGRDYPWGVLRPNHQPQVAGSSSGGSLQHGKYQVAVTHVFPDGEEGGTGVSELVTVGGDGSGSIVLSSFAPAPDGAKIANVYASAANGEQLYKIGETLTGSPQYQIKEVDNKQGRQLETQFSDKAPPGTDLAYHNGRIYIADGKTLWCTLPLRYGQVDPALGMFQFPADITLLASVADGLYVCSDKTYWMTDIDTEQFQQRAVLPYGGVRGTAIDIPLSDNVAWFSVRGLIVAGLSGQVASVQEDKSAVGDYAVGAMLFREENGLRQIVATLGDGTESPLLANDYQN